MTVEQNIILPDVDDDKVESLCAEPALNGGRLSVFPGKIASATVSCTGSQFCGLALIETKATAERMAKKLDESLNVPKPVRIHWTGCPNSCGQVQAGEIGIMGAPAKKFDPVSGKNKAAPGCNIFVGGTIGEHATLALEPYKTGVLLEDDVLQAELEQIIIEHYGGVKVN